MPFDAEQKQKKLRYDDADFLAMVRSERLGALGLESGDELQGDRERALEYFKGSMFDQPNAPNRSSAVHTVVCDMIGQAMPDLVEIFLGGEDIGAFKPIGEEDEEGAKQETAAVNNVISNENDGFGLIHDYVHDALLMKAGVFHAWIERDEAYEEETLRGQSAPGVQDLQMQEMAGQCEVLEVKPSGSDPLAGPLFDVIVARTRSNACVRIETVAPEDFAVARDTVSLRDATYAVARSRPRAQKLKAMGFDAEAVDRIPAWSAGANERLDQSRDTAGESDEPFGAPDAVYDLRQVIIHIHVLRVDADGDGKPEIWRIVTDEGETVLLDKERLDAMPFAAGTPYRQPHRFYGRSLADLAIELQRIMTAMLRLHLDGGYFSINARHEIDENKSNEHTLSDYLNNSPGYPVRVASGGAVQPLVSTSSDFNALESLEYMATVGETRTGITRNAQGLNPDTLHDTAKGAQALMTNAQKRLRLIARTLAETGIRDLFLLVHTLLRTSGMSRPMAMRLKNKWVQVDPTSWGERKDFTVEIGMGAGGREMMLQAGMALSALLDKIVQAQAGGAIMPPIATPKNLFSFADWFREQLGVKRTNFFTDPESEEGQQIAQQAAQQAQQPDPEAAKLQAEMAMRREEAQMQLEAKKAEMAMAERHQQIQFEKDIRLAEQQQRDDMARAETEALDKQRDHELAVFQAKAQVDEMARKAEIDAEKVLLEREKLALERERLVVEKFTKEREFAIREREIEHAASVEGAKLADSKEARSRKAKSEKPDRSGEAIGEGLKAVAEGLKAVAKPQPRKVKR